MYPGIFLLFREAAGQDMGLNIKATYLCNHLGALFHSLRPDVLWGKIGQTVRKLQLWEKNEKHQQNTTDPAVFTLLSFFHNLLAL